MPVAGLPYELVAGLPDGGPVVGPHELDGGRDREERRDVAGALPSVFVHEPRRTGAVAVPPPAHDQRLEDGLDLAASVEERGALRSVHPLVAVAGVEVGAERAQVQDDLAGGVGAVDDRDDPALAGAPEEAGHRKDDRGGRGDVADREDLRPGRDRRPDRLDERVSGIDWDGDRPPHVTRAALGADERPGAVDGAVLVIGREHLVAGPEAYRPRHGVERGGRVREEREVVRVGAHELAERGARRPHQPLATPAQEFDRLALQLALPGLIPLEHRPRARPERAVVEVDDVRPEQEEVSKRGGRGPAARDVSSQPRPRPCATRWRRSKPR